MMPWSLVEQRRVVQLPFRLWGRLSAREEASSECPSSDAHWALRQRRVRALRCSHTASGERASIGA